MRGLEAIKRLNDLEAAKFLAARYEKLEQRAIRRGDFRRADRYHNRVLQFRQFISGKLTNFPDRHWRCKLRYPPEFVEKVRRLDPRNEALARDLRVGRPIRWWFAVYSSRDANQPQRRQLEELLSYYELVRLGEAVDPRG